MPTYNHFDSLIVRSRRAFENRFGKPAEWITAAPGRVNLIGEHTDYNDGLVLPMAIDRYTVLAAAPSPGRNVTVLSDALDGEVTFSLDEIKPPADADERDWTAYIRGVLAGCSEKGMNASGFDAVVCSDVPFGGGLSSSAALEAATATLVEAMTGKQLKPVEKALLCQKAEHEYAGVPCGIMDQFASVMAKAGHLLLIDCRSQKVEHIPFDASDVSVLIINTNVRHTLADGEYAQRRSSCYKAAKKLGVETLRETTIEKVLATEAELGSTLFRRARHIVTENARTLTAADAFRVSDWETVGRYMFASHASLRDDYEVSCRELDLLVELAESIGSDGGVHGARMTGGGFGGCVVLLVRSNDVASISNTILESYVRETNINATAYETHPACGTHVVS